MSDHLKSRKCYTALAAVADRGYGKGVGFYTGVRVVRQRGVGGGRKGVVHTQRMSEKPVPNHRLTLILATVFVASQYLDRKSASTHTGLRGTEDGPVSVIPDGFTSTRNPSLHRWVPPEGVDFPLSFFPFLSHNYQFSLSLSLCPTGSPLLTPGVRQTLVVPDSRVLPVFVPPRTGGSRGV